MGEIEKQLEKVLQQVEEKIDMEHVAEVDQRYLKTLRYEDVDRPPLVVQPSFSERMELPPPWDEYSRYSYREAFENPAAMLQNMLLSRVVPGILISDDTPLAVRNDHGIIQIASLLGGEWKLTEDNYPWVEPIKEKQKLKEIAENKDEPEMERGVMPRTKRTLEYYNEKLGRYPKIDKAVQISLPDLQGPMDTAEQLWGSGIFYAFYEEPELLNNLLKKIVDTMLSVIKEIRKYTKDRLDPDANTQHGYVIPGRLLIRNDSSILLSPEMYKKKVRPHDERLLDEAGGGAIHFCGNGEHLIDTLLEIPKMYGLDFGESEKMDIPRIYEKCRKKKTVITPVHVTEKDIEIEKAKQTYPTGAVFLYHATCLTTATEITRRYQGNT